MSQLAALASGITIGDTHISGVVVGLAIGIALGTISALRKR